MSEHTTDFRQPKLGSKFSIWINEGCERALYGMPSANPYVGIYAQAYDYGYQSGLNYIKGV